jgi:hypothetical protein
MKWWKYILTFLITPLGTPISFALWNGIALDTRSFSGIIPAVPKFFLYTAPVAYMVALLFGIPAILILSRKMWLTFPAIVFVGTFIGTIIGLFAGFYISGYNINGVVDYFSFDFNSIYAPSMISGMICSIIFWVIRTISVREKGLK